MNTGALRDRRETGDHKTREVAQQVQRLPPSSRRSPVQTGQGTTRWASESCRPQKKGHVRVNMWPRADRTTIARSRRSSNFMIPLKERRARRVKPRLIEMPSGSFRTKRLRLKKKKKRTQRNQTSKCTTSLQSHGRTRNRQNPPHSRNNTRETDVQHATPRHVNNYGALGIASTTFHARPAKTVDNLIGRILCAGSSSLCCGNWATRATEPCCTSPFLSAVQLWTGPSSSYKLCPFSCTRPAGRMHEEAGRPPATAAIPAVILPRFSSRISYSSDLEGRE